MGVNGNGKPQISRAEMIVSYALTIVLMVICFVFVLLVAHYVPGM